MGTNQPYSLDSQDEMAEERDVSLIVLCMKISEGIACHILAYRRDIVTAAVVASAAAADSQYIAAADAGSPAVWFPAGSFGVPCRRVKRSAGCASLRWGWGPPLHPLAWWRKWVLPLLPPLLGMT